MNSKKGYIKMSYCYSDSDIERMYNAGILHRPGSGVSQHEADLIERNTKCEKCGGKVKVDRHAETITCKKCKAVIE